MTIEQLFLISIGHSRLIKEISEFVALPESILVLAGAGILTVWLLKTSFGSKSLIDSPTRRTSIHPLVPLAAFLIYYAATPVVVSLVTGFWQVGDGWRLAFLENVTLSLCALTAAAAILVLAYATYARRLKGLGLNPKSIAKDLLYAPINFLAVWPLVMSAIILTTIIGQKLYGPDFRMQTHEELEFIVTFPKLPVLISVVAVAVFVAPVFEELLFRGLFQTVIRSYTEKPWLSIAAASALFAASHTNPSHWPALFVLSIALGYSYEKSGSLFRPIFIHALFNGLVITLTLLNIPTAS